MVVGFVSLLLVRHGQSEWNALRRWQGLADSPLSDLGRRQAVHAASAMAELSPPGGRFHSVRTSPLARAAETGEIIADHLGLGDVRSDDRWREADAGEWQGLTPDEIEAAYPGFLARHFRPSTFEPSASVLERTLAALDDIVTATAPGSGTVIVTTHSGVIRTLIRHLGTPDERVPNLGGVWIAGLVSTAGSAGGYEVRGRFDPKGVVRTGVDAPGEDPGEQPDDGRTRRPTGR